MKFEFCWEHRDCSKPCPVRETQSIFCWRIARTENLCHPETCEACSYRHNWLNHHYSLQEFISKNDRRRGRPKTQRILLVDDEPNFLYALEETVRDKGYSCLTAVDGEEGFFFATESIPDLIITDIMMPKINGYELCQALKANDATKDIPIIVATVRGSVKDMEEGKRAGADVYLVKPFLPSVLIKHIENLFPDTEPA